jgi:hypothetical protein
MQFCLPAGLLGCRTPRLLACLLLICRPAALPGYWPAGILDFQPSGNPGFWFDSLLAFKRAGLPACWMPTCWPSGLLA